MLSVARSWNPRPTFAGSNMIESAISHQMMANSTYLPRERTMPIFPPVLYRVARTPTGYMPGVYPFTPWRAIATIA
jgi:hypothetical protein